MSSVNCDDNNLEELWLWSDEEGDEEKLDYISCMNNRLYRLDLSGIRYLETLYCGNNQLTSLDVSRFPDLVMLNLNGNRVAFLDVTHNPKLEVLGCNDNGFSQPFTLDVSHNQLEIFFLPLLPNNLIR